MVCACGQQAADTGNPFLSEFETPYGTPDFDRIKVEHYEPAFLKGIEQQNGEIKAIVENPEEPSFENTIVALDNSGEILARVSGVFFALTEADTNDEMMALEAKIAPMLSEHSDNIFLNQELYKRVAAVHAQEEAGKIQLTTEQHYLLDKYYKEFVRSGAGLDAQKQERLREINKQLSTLTIEFGNHVLADNNDYLLVVDKKEDLAGLPDAVIAGAAQEAKAHGKDGKWVFTLQESSRTPLLQYAQNRELRKNIYQAYTSLGNRGNANDNKEVLKKVLALRLEKAQLMGFNNFAEYQLADNMAKNPKNALDLLYGLWEYSIKNAKAEAAELQKIMDREGKGEKLEAWDWWYYTEKLRKEKYNLEEEEIKPYFKLENVLVPEVRSRLIDPREYWGGAYGVAAQTQVIKQADVIALLYMLGQYPADIIAANYDYYEPRTEHGSSLSACMYALCACAIGRPAAAYPLFLKSAEADIVGGGKQWAGLVYIGGTHPAAAGGAYMVLLYGFLGLRFEDGKPTLHPRLPEGWKKVQLQVHWQGKDWLLTAEEGQQA